MCNVHAANHAIISGAEYLRSLRSYILYEKRHVIINGAVLGMPVIVVPSGRRRHSTQNMTCRLIDDNEFFGVCDIRTTNHAPIGSTFASV